MKSLNFKTGLFLLAIIILSLPLRAQEEPDISFTVSTNTMYSPGDKVQLTFYSYDYNNKDTRRFNFKIDVLKITDPAAFYSRQTGRNTVDVLGSDSTNLSFYTEEAASFNKTLTAKNDYGYSYLNEVIPLSIYDKGAYVVRVTSGNKVAYTGFIITDYGIISKAASSSMLAYVVNRRSGEPASNAELNFFVGSKQIGRGVTSNGLFIQEVAQDIIPVNSDITYPLIIGKYNDNVIISDPYMYFGYGSNRYSSYIYTNQPVYRTGSEVNFKGTIRKTSNPDYVSVSDRDITVTIKDSRGAEVYKQVLHTNDMGSFDGKYTIDKEAPLGDYNIIVTIDEKNSHSQTFKVEQFKKPEYWVKVTPEKDQYFGRDLLKAKVESKYYFGSPVAEADVEYNIYKVRYYKPWWAFSEYAWWYEDYYSSLDQNQQFQGAQFIHSGTGKLKADGTFDIEYSINEDFKQEQNNYDWWYYRNPESDYKYIVQAKVVDKSRREISSTNTVFVTRGGFYLSSNADKYVYKPGENVNLEVRSFNFSDKPVQTEFEITINKTTWTRHDYKEEKSFVTTLRGKTLSDGKGIVSWSIPSENSEGSYNCEIKARDDRGNEITSSAYFYVSNGDMWWYYNQSGGVQIITDKDSYNTGEVIKALVITTTPGANILLTAQDDEILHVDTRNISGTSAMIEIPVTDKFTGKFDINISYVKEGQFYTASKPVMVMQDKNFLTVAIEPEKEIFKPKESGLLKVKVTDAAGNPVSNAEVSLGIIDESIYAIQPDKTKDIRQFFYGPNFTSVSTAFNSYNSTVGYSRLLTIFERYNIRSLSDKDLATVRGRFVTSKNIPIPNAVIVIDNEYRAAVTDSEGNFTFKLPAGNYSIGLYYYGLEHDDMREISLSRGETKTLTLYNSRELNDQEMEDDLTIRSSREGAFFDGVVTEQSAPTSSPKNEDKKEKSADVDFERKDDLIAADVRSDFRDAILWSPYVITDADGYASVTVDYPDNLTSWKVTSRVITKDTKVGQQTKTIITRKDLLVRMETPRVLQLGDKVTISTVIHNYLSTEKKTQVKFRADGLSAASDLTKTVSIAPNSDVRLDWDINITQPFGEAVLYAEALTDEESDAVQVKVPFAPKGLKLDVNTVADFDDDVKTEIKNIFIPESADIRSAGMKLSLAPSLASTILTALDELAGYPYGCVEQTMSRFLPTVVVASAFKELNAPISEATEKNLPKYVEAGLNRLYTFQHGDGGWGWWTNDQTNPFMSAYVIYGLSIARQSGYQVKEDVRKKGITALKNHLNSELEPTTRAYILYTLAVAEEKDRELFKKEIDKLSAQELNDYALSLIALALQISGNEADAKTFVNRLEKNIKYSGEGAAYWEGKQFHYNWQDDKVQTTAMGLKAIINIDKNSELKNKIIRWLMMQRQGLAWRNTQETAFIIYSMIDYLKTSNELDPSYSVSVFVNNEKVLEKQMSREDVFKKGEVIKISSDKLRAGNNELRIEKSGIGKVYFSSNTTYYGDDASARENGFRVEREYYKLEKYESYSGDKITYRKHQFNGTVTSGDIILVKTKVFAKDNNLSYFLLEDPIPAGCEVIKDDWAYTIDEEKDYGGYDYYFWRWWYADKEIHDDKVAFFATHMYGNEYEFSYILRAQIPGDYNVNPSRGMLMYYTDVNGNSNPVQMTILDK